MTKRYFGTDGIRGLVGQDPITPDFVLKLGWACGKVFAASSGQGQRCRVLIGKDTRISGYMFESALEAGLVAAGVDVSLLGPMPTPAVAYLTRTFSAQAGIVISASHNPFHDNGIKFFSESGEKLPDDIELAIEAELDAVMATQDSSNLGKVNRIADAAGRYIEFCKSTVPSGFHLGGLKIAVDCAHGATYHIAPSVFSELGASVVCIGASPDGININDGVGSTSPAALAQQVLAEHADLGIAFDGDGDRVLFVDGAGNLVDGDELLFIISRHVLEGAEDGTGVVGTLMSNLGLEVALRDLNIPFARAKVGDRYVKAMMRERGWRLGGESSGHIICEDATSTGDGIVAALQVLVALVARSESLGQARLGITKMPQQMINVACDTSIDPLSNDAVAEAVANAEASMGSRGRVLLRPSGTEPLVRVMVEGENPAEVERLCRQISEVVEHELV